MATDAVVTREEASVKLPDRRALRRRLAVEGPQVLRILVAGLVGWQICRWSSPSAIPVFAVVVPVVAMRDDPFSALNISLDRIIGVVAGIVIGIGVVDLFGPTIVALILVLGVGLLTGVVLRVGSALNIQYALSGLLVFANPDPAGYGWSRLWETLVGAGVTVVLSPLLFPPNAAAEFTRRYRSLSRDLARSVSDLAVLVEDAPWHRTAPWRPCSTRLGPATRSCGASRRT